ncbi:hypothetical protein KM800_12725 [Clostridium tyrobutyricum]|uniref:hypothetical protein n=1 Tax=Clostridium tyrobutyricum TaxID=1519 RepID=UPI001C38FA91|nr:hypothetical protein [Clostridium tyrobutyricum]MBV4420176.1 hypothetical protein [Clostridium tyrobutyricum]
MIKINVSEEKMKQIENKHWKWFKNNMLRNWITQIYKDADNTEYEGLFLKIFFEDKNSFRKWFDKQNRESTVNWIEKQEHEKFYIFKNFIIGNKYKIDLLKEKIGLINESIDRTKSSNVIKKLRKYFEGQYNKFRNTNDEWGGAHLVKELDIKVCPYCNRNFVDTYKIDKNGKYITNAQLDHFYSKKYYPYLALSLYNLIPCCSVCNHSKLDKNNEIIYPYEEQFDDNVRFTTRFAKLNGEDSYDLNYLFGNSDNFEIKLLIDEERLKNDLIKRSIEKNIKINLEEKIKKFKERIDKSKEVFNIEKVYNFNKDYVKELIKKAIIYNESRIDELYNQYPELFSSRDEVLNMVVSNYINADDLAKRPLAKLTRDICNELGLQ